MTRDIPTSDFTVRIAGLSPSKRTLLEMKLRKNSQEVTRDQIRRRASRSSLPLSFAQQRLWFLHQIDLSSCLYNNPRAIRMSGPLNVEALAHALDAIVERHESLRTTFTTVEGSPIQVISAGATVTVPLIDLSALPKCEGEMEARRLAQEEAKRPFDLVAGPVMRSSLLRLSADDHVLLLNMHHIISDGWSMGILYREVAALYKAFCDARRLLLPELPIQYADYAAWQREWLQGEVLEDHIAYWKQQLLSAPSVIDLPTDRPRPAVQTSRGAYQLISFTRDLSERLEALSRQEGVTLFMTLLAAFQLLLSHYTKQTDIVVGTDVANRNRVETEGLIGFFINNVVLRSDLSGDPTFLELLARVKEVALGAYAHQEMPFERVVEALKPKRSLRHTPLFQVLFTLQNMPKQALDLPGVTVSLMEVGNNTTKYDLTLFMRETEQGLKGSLDYNTDLFDATSIARMTSDFAALLEDVVARPRASLSELKEILAENEKKQQIREKKEREGSNLKRFKNIKPKAITLPH